MMIVQLLVFTCAYALGAADELPSYRDIHNSLQEAEFLLQKNVLSLDGNITYLNDPRRQYTDIIYVVHQEAAAEYSCMPHDYYKDYQINVNESLPFAVANPDEVLNRIKQRIADVINAIKPIQEVMQSVMMNEAVGDVSGLADNLQIDKVIDEKIKMNGVKYNNSKQVYMAAGLFATQLIQDDTFYFAPNSQNLFAHNFIIRGVEELKYIVLALKNLFDILYGRPLC